MSRSAKAMLFALWVVAAGGASGQATGLPTFSAPSRGFGSWELGASLSRPGGDATGLELRYGARLDRADLSIRGGVFDPGGSSDSRLIAGVEARVPVLGRTQTFPLDGALILGLGHVFVSGDGQTIVPVGLSLGRRIALDGSALQITPYFQPTIIFESDTQITAGLGVDLRVRGIPDVRLARAIGDMEGWSLGLFWPR